MASSYLLDTNIISDLMASERRTKAWIWSLPEDAALFTCTMVLGEIHFGIQKLPMGHRRTHIQMNADAVLANIPCVSVPRGVANHYAAIKQSQRLKGRSLDENDLWIAATAVHLNAVLVTRDQDFTGIAGLTVLAPPELG